MAIAPSAETALRNLKRQFKAEQDARANWERQYAAMRIRATKAEQDASEWRRRFDLLLEKSQRVGA